MLGVEEVEEATDADDEEDGNDVAELSMTRRRTRGILGAIATLLPVEPNNHRAAVLMSLLLTFSAMMHEDKETGRGSARPDWVAPASSSPASASGAISSTSSAPPSFSFAFAFAAPVVSLVSAASEAGVSLQDAVSFNVDCKIFARTLRC